MSEIFHIKRVLIENFRSIDHLNLEFHTDPGEGSVAVLAGDNGCGKTSVLDAIANGFPPLGTRKIFEKDIKQGAHFFGVWFQIISLDGAVSLDNISMKPIDVSNALDETAKFYEASIKISQEKIYFSSNRSSLSSHHDVERRLLNVYTRSIRNGGLKETSPFVRLQEALRPFVGFDWTLDVLFEDERPDSNPKLVFRNDALPDEFNNIEQARKLSKSKKMPLLLTLDQLSSGQIALFSLMGPLVFASSENPPLVLIDEPEQHMHPSWQRALLPALRKLSPLSQFIVATHSVDVLHSVASYERHLLLKDDDPRARDWQAQKEISDP